MVLGRVGFHIENARMGGMGREGMSWDGSGIGARYAMWKKLEKETVFYQQISPRHDCGALLASAGQLVAPLGLLFAFLFITWGVLGQSVKKIRKPNETLSQNGC